MMHNVFKPSSRRIDIARNQQGYFGEAGNAKTTR